MFANRSEPQSTETCTCIYTVSPSTMQYRVLLTLIFMNQSWYSILQVSQHNNIIQLMQQMKVNLHKINKRY